MLNGPIIKCVPEKISFRRNISFLLVGCWICKNTFMHFLLFQWTIPINSFFLTTKSIYHRFLSSFGFRKPLIHHILIVADEAHLSSESFVPMVLRLCKKVHFLLVWGGGALHSLGGIIQLRVISQVIVKGTLVACRLIHYFDTSGIVWDVSVAASSIIGVAYWFWVDCGHWIFWSTFSDDKWP